MNPSSLCCGQHYYFDLETKATVQHQPDKSIGLSPTDSVNEFESREMGVKWHCSHSNSPHSNDVWKKGGEIGASFSPYSLSSRAWEAQYICTGTPRRPARHLASLQSGYNSQRNSMPTPLRTDSDSHGPWHHLPHAIAPPRWRPSTVAEDEVVADVNHLRPRGAEDRFAQQVVRNRSL
jgi:hypothetical protein